MNLTLRRLTTLLIVLMATTSMTWAGSIDMPQEFDETGADLTAPILKGGVLGTSFNLNPILVGDVDDNGAVDIADVTTLIGAVLSHGSVSISADVNGDGQINIADVTALITRVLAHVAETRLSVTELAYAMNSAYKSLRMVSAATGFSHQNFGISAHTIAAEVMGDDMIIGARGYGWFWFDANYGEKPYFTNTSWRSYGLWMAYYTSIAEANSIIAQKNNITGNADLVNYYVGQAYALRAYSYFMLSQWFARTYKGHESDPCVPLFTGDKFNGSTGQPRATVSQVYAQIDADISQALQLTDGKEQLSPEHMSHAVVKGLKSRVCLVKEEWSQAYLAAKEAIAELTELNKEILDVLSFMGVNNAYAANVMWGAPIPLDEVGMNASFFAHMSFSKSSYGQRSPKQISKWLYNKMNETDARRAWWDPENQYSTGGFAQKKFDFSNTDTWEGDYIYMRIEEMYLTAAEAGVRAGITAKAKEYLNALMEKRDPNYTGSNKTGTALGDLTTDETGSLLEEILIQRRIELWGEDGRIHTIKRLHQGFYRNAAHGWPADLLLTGNATSDPECYAWVLTIPQSEFTDNANMNPEFIPVGDQNPLGDYPGTGQNLSFETASTSITTARTNYYFDVTVTRAATAGKYVTSATLTTSADCISTSKYNISFDDGQSTTTIRVTCNPMTLGQTYTGTLTLSPYDVTSYVGGSQISTHSFTINCQNGDPAGQEISFETPTLNSSSNYEYCSLPVNLTRAITDGEYTATISISDNPNNVELGSTSVYFADGVSSAVAWVYFDDMEVGHSYSCVLTLSPQDVSSGGAITSIQITVTYDKWVYLGVGTYVAELFGGEIIDVNVYQLYGSNTYKLSQLFSPNYDVYFTMDGNQVYIQPQECYYMETPDYGTIYMKGYANEDNSGYAGTYDSFSKTATLKIRYYCDAGYWPTRTDTLTMP